jgi:plasmid stability protein
MGQIIVRKLSDELLDTYRLRAQMNGVSLEQEIRNLLTKHGRLTPEEKAAMADRIRARTRGIAPSLTLDEIREGLE